MLPSGLPEYVDNTESLVRFLTSSSLFSGNGVKAAAFTPNPKNDETSVFRHDAEPRDTLWGLSAAITDAGRSLHGAALLSASNVRNVGLNVVAHEPPPRHANIVGWSKFDADPAMVKARNKELALGLAQHATLIQP